jgi:anti-sigma B factor antagonist
MGAANERSQHAAAPAKPRRYPAVPSLLRLELEGGEGEPLLVFVSGEIDYAGAFSMQVRITAAGRQRQARGLILDLAGTEFISSSGLGAIVNLQREPLCLRGGLAISRPTRQVRDILRRTGLDHSLVLVDTVEEAAAMLMYTGAGGDISPSDVHRY